MPVFHPRGTDSCAIFPNDAGVGTVGGRETRTLRGEIRNARRSLALAEFCACVPLLLCALAGCGQSSAPPVEAPAAQAKPPKNLAEYGLFVGNPVDQQPAEGVIPYDLNTPLFTDYMAKFRFVKLPPGTAAEYDESDVFSFPVGTVIAKTFACPVDLRDPALGHRLIETRILKHDPEGWVGLPYLWNADQTEAVLKVAGGTRDVSWVHSDGRERTNNYLIPNANQCKGCHKAHDKAMQPIGPKARHLNRDLVYRQGSENQLAHWTRVGALTGAPTPEVAPRLAVWDRPETGSLDERARAYLDINCAHCHNPGGPARNSGLDLTVAQREPYQFGIYRSPVAAGMGSGGLRWDIVPGKPDDSILLYRMASLHPGVMMPELGKRLVHEEGVTLVRDWIAAIPDPGQPRVVPQGGAR